MYLRHKHHCQKQEQYNRNKDFCVVDTRRIGVLYKKKQTHKPTGSDNHSLNNTADKAHSNSLSMTTFGQ